MESPETRSATSTRAGRYITQPSGYRAFIAASLPLCSVEQIQAAPEKESEGLLDELLGR